MSSRRAFIDLALRAVARGASVGVVAPLLEACVSGKEHGAPPLFESSFDVSPLTSDRTSLVTRTPGFDGTPILITRLARGRFVALSMQCTHEGCPVKPPSNGIIWCPCHGSEYDLEGQVLHGPAQFPLARYATEYHRWTRRLTVRMDAS